MKDTVKKYLIPDKKNDYRPHLLRKTGIAVLAILALGLFAIGAFQNFLFTHTDFLSAVLPPVLVDLANTDRTSDQLAMLTVNPVLTEVAQDKANDMAAKGYFSHTSPSGQSPWYWFSKDGYTFSSAGENLAINFTDSGAVNTAWMNSPEHRANILNGKFTQIGIATAQGTYEGRPTVFVVQEFGRPYGGPAVKSVSLVKAKTTSGNLATKPTPVPHSTSTTSTSVLGASVNDTSAPKVIAETETFIAVDNPNASEPPAVAGMSREATALDTIVTSPHKAISLGYEILVGLVILAIALMIGVEIKRQHPKNVIAGIALLAFIVILMYVYQRMTGTVIVL